MNDKHLTLCLEQTLGHRTHGQNLEAALAAAGTPANVLRISPPEVKSSRLPWALQGSLAASREIHRSPRLPGPIFYHTQTISLFAPWTRGDCPYVVSVDATPFQVDAMGTWYQHRRASAPVERAKRRWYRRALAGAEAIVAWSSWAADSLHNDYGVPRGRILVAHPGAPRPLFDLTREPSTGPVRILFVGGDFVRKGGDQLLRAFQQLDDANVELAIVTNVAVPSVPGVRVEHDIRPGTERLFNAFQEADIFCLPTLGDCTPVAIEEAMAAGLPVVTTSIGANTETVLDGVTGRLVAPGNVPALRDALLDLIRDRGKREAMGAAARTRARELLDAESNAARVLGLLRDVA